MKKFSKFFAVLLSVVLVFSIFCLPVSAKIAGGSIQWKIRLEKVTTPGIIDADSGSDAVDLGNIYKVVVSLDSNVPLNSMQVGVAYDADLFDVCYGDSGDNYLTYPCDADTGFTAAHAILGTLADADAYNASGVGGQTKAPQIKAYGPSHASAGTTFVVEAIPSTDERWTNGIKWGYTDLGAAAPSNAGIFITKYALSNTLGKGVRLPEGQEDLFEVYLMLKDGKTDADVNNTEMRMTLLDYSACSDPTVYGSVRCWMKTSNADTVETSMKNGATYVYTAEAPAAPVLTKAASQVKMTLTSATTVAEPFQYRVISKISGDDWNKYFANTGTENADANAITSVGFVAYKGAAAFDLETAKADANGATDADYVAAETDYIQYDGSEAKFGCRIDFTAKPENDVTYIAYAKYLDANGAAQVVFYDAAESSPVASKYTDMVAAYVGLYGSTFVG